MGRTAYVEERLHEYLATLTEPDEYAIGLILGQTSGQKDYVVHLAKTPPPLTKNVVEETIMSPTLNTDEDGPDGYIKSVKDIQESWVADHAKHVTRMLPGGMWVLGIFVVGPSDISSDSQNIQKLKSILIAIQKHLSCNKFLWGNNNEERLILSFNSVTQKYICKSLDAEKNGILKPVDWKFQGKPTKWHQLEALVDFDQLFYVAADKDPETLKQQLQDILESVSSNVETSVLAIDGKVWAPEDTLESIAKRKKDEKSNKNGEKNNNDKPLHVNLYMPTESSNTTQDLTIIPCTASIRLVGQLVSRTFMHQKADMEEASLAVKQDIIRSLASRLEMHSDSLIEEENGSPEENITLHEPPRRVLIPLPESKVALSDYLFPGEGPEEALLSSQELLDLDVHESNVQKDIELPADPTDFYCQSEINTIPTDNNKESTRTCQTTIYITGFGIAFLVLIIAILVHRLY